MNNNLSGVLNKRNYYLLAFILGFILVGGIIYSNNLIKQKSRGKFDISKIRALNKIIFNLPNMDKEM